MNMNNLKKFTLGTGATMWLAAAVIMPLSAYAGPNPNTISSLASQRSQAGSALVEPAQAAACARCQTVITKSVPAGNGGWISFTTSGSACDESIKVALRRIDTAHNTRLNGHMAENEPAR